MNEIYEEIYNDEEVVNIYEKIEKYEDETKGWAYHNFNHVINVTNIVEEILKKLNYNPDFIVKAKIACLLHDVGALQGKENHAKRSYEFSKKYFERKQIDFEDLELVLDAIKIHSDGFDTDNMIALSLIFADKLDIKKTRVAEAGKEIEGMRQYLYIDDILIDIKNEKLIIDFIVDKNINIKELNEFYFTKKVFKAISSFANKMNLDYEILMNGNNWNII